MRTAFPFILLAAMVFFPLWAAEEPLIYVRPVDATTLDPGIADDFYSAEVIANIFEGLVILDNNTQNIVPRLAEKWNVTDNGKKWRFFIRKNVTFHNNEPLDAPAVVQSFKVKRDTPGDKYRRWKSHFSYVKNIRAVDKFTVEITLHRAHAPFLSALTESAASITAPAAYTNGTFTPIGTGPFRFSKWEKGKSLTVTRNKNYWGTEVKLSRVIFKVVPGPVSRILQLKNQNADVSKVRSLKEREEFLGNKSIRMLWTPTHQVHFLAFNTQKEPFSRREVRLAFSHLLNKPALVRHNFQELAVPAVTPVPPHIWGFNDTIRDYRYNLDKARSLLKKAGLGKGFSCTLYYSQTNVALHQIAMVIARNAKAVKVTVKLVRLPFKELRKRLDQKEQDMVMLGWRGSSDPDAFLYPVFTMDHQEQNRANYSNPKLKALLEKSRTTTRQGERLQCIHMAQEIIHNDVPWIPLYHLKNLAIYNEYIKNLNFSSKGYLIFSHADKVRYR